MHLHGQGASTARLFGTALGGWPKQNFRTEISASRPSALKTASIGVGRDQRAKAIRFSCHRRYMWPQTRETAMTNDPIFIAAVLAALGVLGVLLLGIASFGKGGEFNRKHSNKLMRYRVIGQFIAVVLVVIAAWLARGGN
ncbi:MAG: twin transmembrane helix small protein [Paracoccaceae bacterium]